MTLRSRVHRALYAPKAGRRLSRVNLILGVAIMTSITIAVLETEPTLIGQARTFRVLEIALTILFTVEYLARLWTAPEEPRFSHPLKGRLRWALTPTALVDLIALVPALVLLGATPASLLRLLRLARILRLAKLARLSHAWTLMFAAVASRRYELLLTLMMAGVSLLVSATLLHLVEGPVQPDKFGSIPRALWWAVVTLTTIGYGDVYPVTIVGKMLAGVTAVIGIGLIAAPTGILAAAFSDALQRRREADAEEDPPVG